MSHSVSCLRSLLFGTGSVAISSQASGVNLPRLASMAAPLSQGQLGVPVAGVQKTTIRTFTVEGEEKNERLRPRIPWKETPYIPDDSCRI
jgi:hypothetical protein